VSCEELLNTLDAHITTAEQEVVVPSIGVDLRISVIVANTLNVTDKHFSTRGNPGPVAEGMWGVAVIWWYKAEVVGVLGVMTFEHRLHKSNQATTSSRRTMRKLDHPGVNEIDVLGGILGVVLLSEFLALELHFNLCKIRAPWLTGVFGKLSHTSLLPRCKRKISKLKHVPHCAFLKRLWGKRYRHGGCTPSLLKRVVHMFDGVFYPCVSRARVVHFEG
jgi:hypothetical protein